MSLVYSFILHQRGYVNYFFNEFWEKEGDPRVKQFPLLKEGPQEMLYIMISYLFFVKYLGPYLMSNRKPFELRNLMLVYNVIMVFVNAYFFIEGFICLEFGGALRRTEFPDKNDYSLHALRCVNSGFHYYLSKYVDLLDTIFFVLRKKDSQVTFLHLYHHTSVPTLGWIAMKVGPTCPGLILFAVLNSFIHVIMYSYYALAAFGSKMYRYLWWKKYITQLQLSQFAILLLYGLIAGKYFTGYKPIWFWLAFSQPPIFLYLFYNFYSESYKKSEKKVN